VAAVPDAGSDGTADPGLSFVPGDAVIDTLRRSVRKAAWDAPVDFAPVATDETPTPTGPASGGRPSPLPGLHAP
jgi:hypothetical protein